MWLLMVFLLQALGMKLLRKVDNPQYKVNDTMVWFGLHWREVIETKKKASPHFVACICSIHWQWWAMQMNMRQLFLSWLTIMVWLNIPREMHMHRLVKSLSTKHLWIFSAYIVLCFFFFFLRPMVYLLQVAIGTNDVYKSAEVVNLVSQELGGKITRQPGPLPGINTKITSFLDPDGWKTVSLL